MIKYTISEYRETVGKQVSYEMQCDSNKYKRFTIDVEILDVKEHLDDFQFLIKPIGRPGELPGRGEKWVDRCDLSINSAFLNIRHRSLHTLREIFRVVSDHKYNFVEWFGLIEHCSASLLQSIKRINEQKSGAERFLHDQEIQRYENLKNDTSYNRVIFPRVDAFKVLIVDRIQQCKKISSILLKRNDDPFFLLNRIKFLKLIEKDLEKVISDSETSYRFCHVDYLYAEACAKEAMRENMISVSSGSVYISLLSKNIKLLRDTLEKIRNEIAKEQLINNDNADQKQDSLDFHLSCIN